MPGHSDMYPRFLNMFLYLQRHITVMLSYLLSFVGCFYLKSSEQGIRQWHTCLSTHIMKYKDCTRISVWASIPHLHSALSQVLKKVWRYLSVSLFLTLSSSLLTLPAQFLSVLPNWKEKEKKKLNSSKEHILSVVISHNFIKENFHH